MFPVKIDVKTNLVEIAKDNRLLNYKYVINASIDNGNIEKIFTVVITHNLNGIGTCF